jgi:hypothetical protein
MAHAYGHLRRPCGTRAAARPNRRISRAIPEPYRHCRRCQGAIIPRYDPDRVNGRVLARPATPGIAIAGRADGGNPARVRLPDRVNRYRRQLTICYIIT